jgi:hypothetical protein
MYLIHQVVVRKLALKTFLIGAAMEAAEAILAIRSNWPDERYTMLREALTKTIAALEAIEAGQPAHNNARNAIAAFEEWIPVYEANFPDRNDFALTIREREMWLYGYNAAKASVA